MPFLIVCDFHQMLNPWRSCRPEREERLQDMFSCWFGPGVQKVNSTSDVIQASEGWRCALWVCSSIWGLLSNRMVPCQNRAARAKGLADWEREVGETTTREEMRSAVEGKDILMSLVFRQCSQHCFTHTHRRPGRRYCRPVLHHRDLQSTQNEERVNQTQKRSTHLS